MATKKQKKARNPFIYEGYEGPEYFCDRTEETEKIISHLTNGRNITLVSPRKIGKTGLIKHVFNRISELSGLQKYSIDLARRRASIPKFQVYNNALKMVFNPLSFEQAIMDRKEWGRIYESGIGCYLVSQAFVHRFDVFYWREKNDEVDFILRKKGIVLAIEVKSNAEKSTTGLNKFKEMFHPQSAFIVGEGGVSAENFLSMNIAELFK